MKWIEDKASFDIAFRRAFECAATDSGRLPTSLRRLTFDDIELRSDAFAGLLQNLLVWSGDDACSFVVLRPDPVYYFHHFFKRYPVVEVERGMSADEFIAMLNEGPPESRPDALGIIYSEYVVVPSSMRWFVHALRTGENDGGHLWVPPEWLEKVAALYPYATADERHPRAEASAKS
jgi:hypothetical protein